MELANIVAVVTHEFEMMASQKEQAISLDTEPGVVRGNVDELGILIRNLLDNALRYGGRGCRIAVRCRRGANAVVLEVLDSGPGVAEADRDRIFDRFYRGAGNSEAWQRYWTLARVAHRASHMAPPLPTGVGLHGRGFSITVCFLRSRRPRSRLSRPLQHPIVRAMRTI